MPAVGTFFLTNVLNSSTDFSLIPPASILSVSLTETDLPVLTCAGVKFKDTGVCNICIGARPGRAIVVKDTERILAGGINEKSVEEFSTFVKKNVPTAGNMRGSAEYRSHLSGVLAGRALQNINRD